VAKNFQLKKMSKQNNVINEIFKQNLKRENLIKREINRIDNEQDSYTERTLQPRQAQTLETDLDKEVTNRFK